MHNGQIIQSDLKPEPFTWRKMVPLCWILLNSCTSWLLPLSLSLSLMHFTKPSLNRQQQFGCQGQHRLWIRGPPRMMDRPVMVVQFRFSLDDPRRAVPCWLMNKFYLCHQEVTTEQLAVTGQGFGTSWRVWRAGKCSSPQLQQDKFLSISREAAAVPRQSLQTGLEGSFANGVPTS